MVDPTNTNSQPAPKIGRAVVYTELIKDIERRAKFGRNKYGQDLMTEDGRDTLVDAYQEALDLCMYLKKLLMEQETFGYEFLSDADIARILPHKYVDGRIVE